MEPEVLNRDVAILAKRFDRPARCIAGIRDARLLVRRRHDLDDMVVALVHLEHPALARLDVAPQVLLLDRGTENFRRVCKPTGSPIMPVDLSTRKNLISVVFSGISVTQPNTEAIKQVTPTAPITQPVTIAERPRMTRSADRSITARNFACFDASVSGLAVQGDILLTWLTWAALRTQGGRGPKPRWDRCC